LCPGHAAARTRFQTPLGHRSLLHLRFQEGISPPQAGRVLFPLSEFASIESYCIRLNKLLFLRDNRSNINLPLLTGAYYADPVGMTIEKCVAFCDNQPVSYRLMAVTDGFQCCASSVEKSVLCCYILPQHATISLNTFSRA
jgi:hypothetical protein